MWSESTSLDRRPGGRVRDFVKRRALGLCDGFLVPGKAARAYLEMLGAPSDKTHTVLDAVDTAFFRKAAELHARDREAWRRRLGLPRQVILYVGRLSPWKGVGDLLMAFERLRAGRDVGLLLVGGGPGLESLRRRALSRGWDRVFLPGFARRDRLAIFYAVADIFVLPSWSEPWGLVVNEAMACGLPVVVSSAAGCALDLVRSGENGFVYPARDVEGLRASIEGLLDRPDLRARMGETSRRVIAACTPGDSARRMAQALFRIAGRGVDAEAQGA